MSKKSHSNRVFQQGKDEEQPETETDTITMGNMSLEKAERIYSNKPEEGSR